MNRLKNMIVGCGLAAAAIGMASVATSRNAVGATSTTTSASRSWVEKRLTAKADKSGPLETENSRLTAEGKLQRLLKNVPEAPWTRNDGKVFVYSPENSYIGSDGAYNLFWHIPDENGDSLAVLFAAGAGYDTILEAEANFEYTDEDGNTWSKNEYNIPYITAEDIAYGDSGSSKKVAIRLTMTNGLASFDRKGWTDTGDLANVVPSKPIENEGVSLAWDIGKYSGERTLTLKNGEEGNDAGIDLKSADESQRFSLFVNSGNAYGIRVGKDGDPNARIKSTGDVVANSDVGNGFSLIGLYNSLAETKENLPSDIAANAPITNVTHNGTSLVKDRNADLSNFLTKDDSVVSARGGFYLSSFAALPSDGSMWNFPTMSCYLTMFSDLYVDNELTLVTWSPSDDPRTKTYSGFMFYNRGKTSCVRPDGSDILTKTLGDSLYIPILSPSEVLDVGGVSANNVLVKNELRLVSHLDGSNVFAYVQAGSKIGEIYFRNTASSADAPTTLTIDNTPILTQGLADTLYATKGLRVSDYKSETIRDGMLDSRKPTAAETVTLKIYAGDFSIYEGSAKMFLDCSTAASSLSLAVSDSSSLTVLYRDGCVKLNEFASPNVYVFEFRWFKTSASGTEVKYAIVNAYKVGQ